MLETLLATICVGFAPTLTEFIVPPGGLVMSMIFRFIINLGIIVAITIASNIVIALRNCRDDKGNFDSFGLSFGIKKGLLNGSIAIAASIAVAFVPILRAPYTLLVSIPGIGKMIDGIILSLFYLISDAVISGMIWGVC